MTPRINRPLIAAGAALVVLAGCERPPMESEQLGYRGTGIAQISNPRIAPEVPPIPDPEPSVPQGGITAGQAYQNVQVLGDLSVAEFTRTMNAITKWVSPEQGCNYCHNPQNLASDDIYTKVVSRRMFQMTQHINEQWGDHVGQTGVTCYTCHMGQNVPANIWFERDAGEGSGLAADRAGQNLAGPADVGYTSMAADPFSALLTSKDANNIRVLDTTAFADGGATIQATELTYNLMNHMSGALGVNCTYCHNSNNFGSWSGSRPQRVTAYHGIQMVKALNQDYLIPLGPEYPENRLGPLGDAPKAYCSTCHAGLPKPLGGAAMAEAYPAIWR